MDLKVHRLSRIDENIEKIESLHLLPDTLAVNLHANCIQTISGLDGLTSLVELDLSANSISRVSGLDALVCLKVLNLASNSIAEVTPSEIVSLVSLRHMNISYNLVRSVSFLTAFANPESSLVEFLFHGNEVSHVTSTCQMLEKVRTLRRISIAENPITSSAETIFASCPRIQAIDGVSRDGSSLDPLDVLQDPIAPKSSSQIPPPDNPWRKENAPTANVTMQDFGVMARHMLQSAQTHMKAEHVAKEHSETNEKIERIERQLAQLLQQNRVPVPSAGAQRKSRPPTMLNSVKKCAKCTQTMKEMRKMASSFEETSKHLQDEVMVVKNESFSLHKRVEDQQLDINQKNSQLQTALDGLVKFKNLATSERDKADSLESSLARTLKELTNEKRAMKNIQDEVQLLKHRNVKSSEENSVLNGDKDVLFDAKSKLTTENDDLKEKLKLATEKLSVSIHPDSPQMTILVKEKLAVAVKYMDEWKSDAKKRYTGLEQEFRDALRIEENEKNLLRVKIDELKEQNAELRINQERLFFSEKKAKDTVDMVASGAKEIKRKNSELEDKIDRLVDALRKAKELADQRYRDEQRARMTLQEAQKNKAKLISTLTEQEGILNGLKAERDQWSRGLASQTSDLAKEKGHLIAENDALKEKLDVEAHCRTRLKIKEKELDSAIQQTQDLKHKLDQTKRESQDFQGDCEAQSKLIDKLERRLARGEADREQLLDEKEAFFAQKKDNEKKWRERTQMIENLEGKLGQISGQKKIKEDEMIRELSERDNLISELHGDIDNKENSIKDIEKRLQSVIHFESDNRKLAMLVKGQAIKIKEVEEELRQLLLERENDKIALHKKFQDFAKHLNK